MIIKIFPICIMAIVACIFSSIIKKEHKEYSVLISLVSGILIFLMILSKLMPIINELKELIRVSNINSEYMFILLKSVGICFITQFTSDCCTDAGEKLLSNKVELAGKISILLVAMPLFTKISEIALQLINGNFKA